MLRHGLTRIHTPATERPWPNSPKERGLKKLTEQYLELVTKEGGSFDEPDYWGRRKLAYEIAGKTEGNYVVVKYTAEPATSDELDRVLNLNESVIRTKILRKG